MQESAHRHAGAWRRAVGDEAGVREPAGDPPGGGLITRSRRQVQRVSTRHQRFRRDERSVRDVLHGAVSGTHHDPGGRAAGRHRRRDRVHRQDPKEGAIVDALELDTPALYVDLDVLERNVKRMQEQCRAWGVALRPHVKTHKIAEIAQMQLDAGAIGITVAKLGEAEVLPGDDVLVAYPIVKPKLSRLRELAKRRRVKVAVDSVEVARDLQGKGIETLVEIDVGVGRCGAQSPGQAVAIAQACSAFQGIFYWPSWLDEAGFQAACGKIDALLHALAAAGFEATIVSGGSTPGAAKTPLIPRTTEIRPGTYVFYDASSLAAKVCVEADCALRVLTTVVSTPVPGQGVIDAGSKTLSSDQTAGRGPFGHFIGRPWTMRKLNEEHGYVEIDGPPRVGEKVWVVPSHVCATVNLHDEIWYGRRGRVEGSWKVAARGKVR